jgi:hypothetical protein
MAEQVNLAATQARENPPGPDEIEGDGWTVRDGRVSTGGSSGGFRPDGVVPRDYQPNILRSIADCDRSGYTIH